MMEEKHVTESVALEINLINIYHFFQGEKAIKATVTMQ